MSGANVQEALTPGPMRKVSVMKSRRATRKLLDKERRLC